MAETRSKADFVTTLRAVQTAATLTAYHRDTIILALQHCIEDDDKSDTFYSAAQLVKMEEICDLLRDVRNGVRRLDPGGVSEALGKRLRQHERAYTEPGMPNGPVPAPAFEVSPKPGPNVA